MKLALISVFLLASFAVALSLKCYVCTDCTDDGKETTCPSGLDMCVKLYGKNKDGKKETVRSCTNKQGCEEFEKLCKESKDDCEVGCCGSDLCNSGAAPSFSVLLVSLCSLFAVVSFIK